VRLAQAMRDLHGEVDYLGHRRRRAREAIAQRLALEELRHDVGRAVVRADVVDGQNVRMIERAGGQSFLLEATQQSWLLERIGSSDCDGSELGQSNYLTGWK